jgi:hypothetical protein
MLKYYECSFCQGDEYENAYPDHISTFTGIHLDNGMHTADLPIANRSQSYSHAHTSKRQWRLGDHTAGRDLQQIIYRCIPRR